MDEHAQLRFLLELAESAGIVVRLAPAAPPGAGGEAHPGGALVRLRDREILFLDASAAVADRIAVTAAALAGRREILDQYLPPQIRELIESGEGQGSGDQ